MIQQPDVITSATASPKYIHTHFHLLCPRVHKLFVPSFVVSYATVESHAIDGPCVPTLPVEFDDMFLAHARGRLLRFNNGGAAGIYVKGYL